MACLGFRDIGPQKVYEGFTGSGPGTGLKGQVNEEGKLFLGTEPYHAAVGVAQHWNPEQRQMEARQGDFPV